MLVKGNSKIGASIWHFSIPAGSTCPGKSECCDERCYAQKGMFNMPSVKRSHDKNLEASQHAGFVEDMVDEIKRKRMSVVRLHCSGDLYSVVYVRKWHEIVKACPDVIFYAYTRSWRIPEINEEITNFVKCKNLRMWFSIDGETGYPTYIPEGVRTAYMSIALHDIPDHDKTDLVFRDYGIRGIMQKRINGIIVCPPENGVTDLTCEKCKICWKTTTPVPKGRADSKRTSLQLVA